MKYTAKALMLGVSAAVFSSVAAAADVHEHGIAELSLAIEARTLEVLLSVPADSLVGFEHKATREADIQAVQKAEAQLRQAYNIISLPKAAACVLKTAQVEHALLDAKTEQDDAHKDHKHEHADHKHEHEEHQHEHEEHKHEHADHKHEHDEHQHAHTDVRASYQFQCLAPEQLSHITFGGFQAFPAIEQVRYQFIGDKGQTGGTLSPAHASIALSE